MPVIEVANENIYFAGEMGMEAKFDRVLVLEDEFKSGYECATCNETGKLDCHECINGRSKLNHDIKCKICEGKAFIKCADCNGTGALLHVSDESKRRPTTGVVVSVGKNVEEIRVGERYAYSSYCGEVYDLRGVDQDGKEITVALRSMKEREIIVQIYGDMNLKRARKHTSQTTG